MTQVTVVGIGRMGAPICACLVRAGHQVTASDADPAREAAALAAGAVWEPSAAAAAARCEVLVTVLPGPAEVGAVMGPAVVAALPPGATWIDMTSTSPQAAAEVRGRLAGRPLEAFEAPIGGSPRDAAAAGLRLFVGGDAELIARHRPLLEAVADPAKIVHTGGPGTGYALKLLVNALWFGQAVATAEALLLGRRAGVDLALMREVLADSAAGSAFVRHDLDALFAGDYLESFGLDHICEQLSLVASMADAHGTPHEVADSVRRLYARALDRYGPADGELLAVKLLEERAGLRLRP
jgi:3-hydroxyisobutyrate dehydrogenase